MEQVRLIVSPAGKIIFQPGMMRGPEWKLARLPPRNHGKWKGGAESVFFPESHVAEALRTDGQNAFLN